MFNTTGQTMELSRNRYHHIYGLVLLLFIVHGTATVIQKSSSNQLETDSSNPNPTGHPSPISTLKNDPYHPVERICVNGYGFESLDECQDVCNFTGSSNTVRIVNANSPVTYKLLTLPHDAYSINDGKLKAKNPAIESFDFIIRNGTAFICYQFERTFVNCMHRCVEEDGLYLAKDGAKLFVNDYHSSYNLHEFYLMNDTSLCSGAAICISKLTLIFQKLEDIHLILDTSSAACLWITLALCLILPEMQMKHNRALVYHLAMLAIGYTIICWKSAAMMYVPVLLTDEWCIILSCVQQFALLSAFFWMNVQSYELYSSLRQPLWPDILSWLEKKRWVLHWMCGWLLPFVITVLSLVAEVLVSPKLSPGFAEECWFNFNNKIQLFVWYYGWMAISLFINLILFIFISKSLQMWSKDVEIVNTKSLAQTFVVLVKLMFIMGFCWCLNLLRWSLSSRGYVVYALDMIRALQGVYIFIAYVCRRRLWMAVISRCLLSKKQEKEAEIQTQELKPK